MARSKFRGRPPKIVAIRDQAAVIRWSLPSFDVRHDGRRLVATGTLQPGSLCATYKVRVEYRLGEPPATTVLSPELKRRGDEDIPHMYLQKRLCLFEPWRDYWTPSRFIAKTIIPWASLWLYYYEFWHATGEWLGGGHQPAANETIYEDDADEGARQAVSYSQPGWGRDSGSVHRRIPC